MLNIADKFDGGSLPAVEFNSMKNELENVITDTEQVLSGSDDHQLSKSMANYAVYADFYSDLSTVADTFILSASSPRQAPTGYMTGMRIRFVAAHTNTGAAVTVNVAGLGPVAVTLSNGLVPFASNIEAGKYYELMHNGTNFILPDQHIRIFSTASLFSDFAISAMPPTTVPIIFDTIVNNIGSCYNGTTGRFTPKFNGYYLFVLTAKVQAGTATSYVNLMITKNGTSILSSDSNYIRYATVDHITSSTSIVAYLTTTDYVDFRTNTTSASGAIIKTHAYTYMTCSLVRMA